MRRFRHFAGILIALLLGALPAAAQPSTQLCVTRIRPTPLLPVPNWWANPVDHEGAQSPFDSAWSGASKYHFTYGTDPHVTFRAGFVPAGTNDRDLLLQWIVWVDPLAPDAGSGVWVLFAGNPDGTGAFDALGIHLLLDVSTAGGPNNVNIDQVVYKSAGGNANWQSIAAAPGWIAATARQWVNTTQSGQGIYAWGIALKVPVRAGQTFNNPINGIPPFQRLMYQVEVRAAPQGSSPGEDVFYVWPAGSSTPAAGVILPESYWPDSWGAVSFDATCPAVSLAVADIGATRLPNPGEDPATLPLTAEISRTAPTMFHARPQNNTGQATPPITARFRLADWGSQVGSFNAPGTGWKDLTLLQQDWNPANPTQPTTVNIPTGQHGDITQIAGPPSAAWLANHTLHQCLYVELFGTGGGAPVLLSPDSAWRNLDVASASEFKGTAKLSIAGLARTGEGRRDVYVYLIPRAMPRTEGDRAPPPLRREEILPVPDQRAEIELRETGRLTRITPEKSRLLLPARLDRAALARRPLVPLPSHSVAQIGLPSYQVHVYHDTGRRLRGPAGQEIRVLQPQGSFGYSVTHAGDLEQTLWAQLTEVDGGAESRRLVRITDHFYRLTLEDGGSTTLTTHIIAADPRRPYLKPGLGVTLAGIGAIAAGAIVSSVAKNDLDRLGAPGTPGYDQSKVDRANTMTVSGGALIGVGTLGMMTGALLLSYKQLTPPSLGADAGGLVVRF